MSRTRALPVGLSVLLLLHLLTTFTACKGPGAGLSTPLEEAQADVLTSYDDMMSFLQELRARTGAFTLDTIGTSTQGRSLVLLRFTGQDQAPASADERLRVFIFAQQHGNEPSGKEAAMALARDIATGAFDNFMPAVDFYLIPQVNPDGSEARQRRNGEDKDLNRDHLTLTTPEVQAVHRVFHEVMPHVVLDVHEYGITGSSWVEKGIRKNFGQQIGGLSNANMPLSLRNYAWDRVIATMEDELVSRDVRLQRYLVTDGPDARFRYSTAAINDGRNSTGIYNTLSFLIEGRNGLTVEENIRERARQQLETMKAFLSYFGAHAQEVRELVESERANLAGPNPPEEVHLVMDYEPDPERPTLTVGTVDVETGEEGELVIEAFHPQVVPTLSVQRPLGYLINESHTEILGVLRRHGVEMELLEEGISGQGEAYLVRGVEETVKEDKPFLDVDVLVVRGDAWGHPGDYWIPCRGLQSNLIVTLLEPQSQFGLAQLPEFEPLLEVGSRPYPVRRVMELDEVAGGD